MARIYGEIQSSGLMTFDKSFSRSNGQPLDSTEVFYSLVAAQDYAKTDVAYVGQKIVVVETVDEVTTVTHYGIEADHSLKELGAIPVGDGVTVEVVDGKIQLAALEGHASGTYQPFLVDGKIEWREPSATTVEGLDGRLTTAEGDIDALEGVVGKAASEGVEATGLVKSVADNAAAIAAVEDKIGEVSEDKTVVEMIADAQTAATYDDTKVKEDIQANADAIAAIEADYLKEADKYDDTELSGRVTAVEGDVATIKGDYLKASDKTELSEAIDAAEESAVDRVLGYLSEEVVNEKYDTLKEVAAWIESDTTASAELITRISNIEKDYLKGADKTDLEGEIDALSAYVGDLPEGAASATVVAYIQEVVNGLKIGDYAKAADLTDLAERVTTLEGKAHEHANKDVIDGITSEKVAAWDAAEQNTKDYADAALENKVNVEEGKSLISDTLIAKLEGIAEGAQVNVIDSVDDAQFDIDESKKLTLLDIAMGKVTGLQDALDAKANKGTTLAEYGITDAYTKTETEARIQDVLDGLSDTSETAASVSQALETYKTANNQRVDTIEGKLANIADGAQVNVIEVVKVGDTVLDIVDKTVVIPVGAGLKASDEITIAADGALGIGEVNVNKLVQTDGDELILNGGAAV
jgi:hypothetical protein